MDRITYICSATRYQLVNLIPLIQIGLDAVQRIIVLIGSHNPPRSADRYNAIDPAARLIGVVKELAYTREIDLPIDQYEAAPEEPQQWHNVAFTIARKQGQGRYVFNVTGGMAAMQFGALSGLAEAQRQMAGVDVRGILLSAAPARVVQIYPIFTRQPEYVSLLGGFSLQNYLDLHGYVEIDPHQRAEAEAAASQPENVRLTRELFNLLTNCSVAEARGRLSAMHRLAGRCDKIYQEPKHEIGPNDPLEVTKVQIGSEEWVEASWALYTNIAKQTDTENFYVTRCDGTVLKFQNHNAVKYFAGRWFEEVAFIEARETLGEDLQNIVSYGVRITLKGGGDLEVGDLDVAILIGGQLHVVECKAGSFGRQEQRDDTEGIGRSTIKKMASIKRNLVGPYGTAALLCLQNPTNQRTRFVESLRAECEQEGVELWIGPDGLRQYREWLRGLAHG
jgi:hypothetical protein